MDEKRTPWFNAIKEPPVRIGWYEFYDSLWGAVFCMYWNGKNFCGAVGRSSASVYSGDKWRGLANEPK